MTVWRSGLVLCLIAAATVAIGGPIDRSPRPLPRPPISAVLPLAAPGIAHAPTSSPRPRVRPKTAPPGVAFAETAVLPMTAPPVVTSLRPHRRPDAVTEARPVDVAAAQPRPKTAATKSGSVCGDPSIKGQSIAPIAAKIKGCGLEDGVKITSIAGIKLSEAAVLDCTTAKSLENWVKNAVLPAVGNSGGGVESLQVAASYVCRPRNNQNGNRVSEHGRGRAIDVAAIVLQNGAVISVLKDWGKGRYGKILKKIRKAACGPFTTVLGPGSDSYHRNHLHLDTAPGRGPYCK